MKTLKDFIKNNYEYLNLGIIAIMLVLACFFDAFSVVVLLYMLFVSFVLNTEQILKMQILALMFARCYTVGDYYIHFYQLIFIFGLIKNFVADIVIRKKKINWKVFLVVCLLILYIWLFPTHKVDGLTLMLTISSILTLYFAYEARENLHFVGLIKMFCYSILFSAFISLFISYSDKLKSFKDFYYFEDTLRFSGLLWHPNDFSDQVTVAISMLFALKLYDKISVPEFLILVWLLFIFGYKTLSRSFILIVIIEILIFSFLYIKKYGAKELKFVFGLIAILLATCLLFGKETNLMIYRVENPNEKILFEAMKENVLVNEKDGLSPEDYLHAIYRGDTYYDPGRIGLWTLYLKRIFMTPMSAIFGYGISAPDIGRLHAHNYLLYYVYHHGIVGLFIGTVLLLLLIDWKKLKNYKNYFGLAMIMMAYVGVILLNCNRLDNTANVVLLAGMAFINSDKYRVFSKSDKRDKFELLLKVY